MSFSLSCEDVKCKVNCPKCNTEHELSLDIISSELVTCSNCEHVFKVEPVKVEIKIIEAEAHLCVRSKPRYNIGRSLVSQKYGVIYKITDIQPFTNKGYTYTLTPTIAGRSELQVVDFGDKDKDNIRDYIALEI